MDPTSTPVIAALVTAVLGAAGVTWAPRRTYRGMHESAETQRLIARSQWRRTFAQPFLEDASRRLRAYEGIYSALLEGDIHSAQHGWDSLQSEPHMIFASLIENETGEALQKSADAYNVADLLCKETVVQTLFTTTIRPRWIPEWSVFIIYAVWPSMYYKLRNAAAARVHPLGTVGPDNRDVLNGINVAIRALRKALSELYPSTETYIFDNDR